MILKSKMLLLLFLGDVLVVAHDEVVGALHEAGEFIAAVGTQEVGAGFGDEDVVFAAVNGLLDEEEFVARVLDDGFAVLHPQ